MLLNLKDDNSFAVLFCSVGLDFVGGWNGAQALAHGRIALCH